MDFDFDDKRSVSFFGKHLFSEYERSVEYEPEVSGTNHANRWNADDYFVGDVDMVFCENESVEVSGFKSRN